MDREDAVALLKELGTRQLIQPSLVLIEKRNNDSYQLKIKGNYYLESVEAFLSSRGFSYEENKEYLVIF